MVDAATLHDAIAAVCPIFGVAGPVMAPSPWTTYPASDGSQWRIDLDPAATTVQQQAGIAALAAYVEPTAVSTVTGRQIKDQVTAGGYSVGLVAFLTKAGQAGGPKPDDYIYWLGIALDTDIPIDNPKVGRVLVGGGVVNADGSSAVAAFMTAAQALPA